MSRRITIVHKVDKVVNGVLAAILLIVLLFGLYSIWDTWQLMNGNTNGSDLTHYKPNPGDATHQSLEELMAINPDVCAWLTIDKTGIDYPVLQGKDNFQYLTLDAFKKYSLMGSLFLDYQCDKTFNSCYQLIHGHHMEGSAMFGDLGNFEKEDYFRSHFNGYLMTVNKTYKLEIFACLHSVAKDPYVYSTYNPSQASNKALLEHIKNTAVCYRNIGLTSSDKILAMSTCASGQTSERTIVFAKMVEK